MVERTGSNRPANKHEKPGLIRNIIFDLGNVLIRFSPSDFLNKRNITGTLKEIILNDIFASEEWLLLDKADITIPEASKRISQRSVLGADMISSVFGHRNETLEPLTENTVMLPELKRMGFRLFYLSNFPYDMWEHVTSRHDKEYSFFRFFEGGIISAEVRCAKPDPAIYRHLLEKYNLEAEECLFIDDLPANTTSAIKMGMKALVTYGSTEIRNEVYEFLNNSAKS